MSESGYYRHPSIHGDSIVFVCEDDLWTVAASGGTARRLTANPGRALWPALSPDGGSLAYIGYDEGTPEVYCMPAVGGEARRLTFSGASNQGTTWTPDGRHIVFATNAGQPFPGLYELRAVSPGGGEPEHLPVGPALTPAAGRMAAASSIRAAANGPGRSSGATPRTSRAGSATAGARPATSGSTPPASVNGGA